jgi:imidazole glycerol phosphate synthase glutamine amidotransferase subunit
MKAKIAVLDYDIGNVKSVIKALEFVGAKAVLTDHPEEILKSAGLVVPGVSAFGACIEKLRQKKIFEFLQEYLVSGRRYLGICLGYQILFEGSEESPGVPGLKIFHGYVRKFSPGVRIPHIGWNSVEQARKTISYDGIPNDSFFYFVHSYFPEPADKRIISGWCEYGERFAASIESQNIWAVQFHPEKSSKNGLKLLENFYRWCLEGD